MDFASVVLSFWMMTCSTPHNKACISLCFSLSPEETIWRSNVRFNLLMISCNSWPIMPDVSGMLLTLTISFSAS
uniref:Uncharacterized protein n=1 Tax=Arundo donax TaxID=35708 RepID=A0A0A9DC11_ARUDO